MLRRYLLLVLLLLVACGGAQSPEKEPVRMDVPAPGAAQVAADEGVSVPPPSEGAARGEGGIAWDVAPGTFVPVTGADPQLGSPTAPVTIVVFGDFQCPFTAKYVSTLSAVLRHRGADTVRVVWKDNPLSFHPRARPAAIAAESVFHLGGSPAFFRFHDLVFENQRELGSIDLAALAERAGVDPRAFRSINDSEAYAGLVDGDAALAEQVGVRGTPASFINGLFLSGAQPIEKVEELVDQALGEAQALARQGVPPTQIYAQVSDKHAADKPAPPLPTPTPAEDDKTVWRVPVGSSPVKGNKSALVTIVLFSDIQCPFCSRVQPTVDALLTEYPNKVRLVWKHQPLPFHVRAEPAAELLIEARAQRGDKAFFDAVDLLFANQRSLEDTDLLGYAKTLGLDVGRVQKAIEKHTHKAIIDEDTGLATDVEASGTPHFFINGRRLVGAQPADKFRALIDEELAKAQKLVASGTPASQVYETLQKGAKAGAELDRIIVPGPTNKLPGKGAKVGAKVVIQVFADLQCPFCKRANATIDELIAANPGKIRVVYRHLPLPMHKDAQLAAEAAMEAFRQKGDDGFWKMVELLYDAQTGGLERPVLEAKAAELGLDMAAFKDALDTGRHRAAVQADKALADSLGISGTPAFAVNDYYVSGAQPLSKFQRVVNKALGPYAAPGPGAKVMKVANP